jgi:streptomycin 6-kinase
MAITEDYDGESSEQIDGRNWLDVIHDTTRWCADQWNLTIGHELRLGLVGYVMEATDSDDRPLVLKLRDPGRLYQREVAALGAFNGRGAAKIISSAPEKGAMLLERVNPGTEMGELADRVDTAEGAVGLIKTLHNERGRAERLEKGRSAGLLEVDEQMRHWAKSVREYDGSCFISEERRARAADQLEEFVGMFDITDVIHGDLHVGNILREGESGWRSVDPKGLLGSIEFELAWWLRDAPTETSRPAAAVLQRRLDALVDAFGVDRDLLLEWARSLAVMLTVSRCSANIFWDGERQSFCVEALDSIR